MNTGVQIDTHLTAQHSLQARPQPVNALTT